MGNPMPESALNLYHRRLYPPVRDLGFALSFFRQIGSTVDPEPDPDIVHGEV
jgi:hypothetical protein